MVQTSVRFPMEITCFVWIYLWLCKNQHAKEQRWVYCCAECILDVQPGGQCFHTDTTKKRLSEVYVVRLGFSCHI